jgi:hypothetical protein
MLYFQYDLQSNAAMNSATVQHKKGLFPSNLPGSYVSYDIILVCLINFGHL